MSATITRNPTAASHEDYDLILIGAGVHGACLALEAARRGLRPLLIERDDFGGGASGNSLRVLHGGLRYLQSFDLKRFAESVAERNWFMRHFPEQTLPLRCLMPLYNRGLKRPSVMRAVLTLNDLLSRQRNQGLLSNQHLLPGSVISRAETMRLFPEVEQTNLTGAAIWCDGLMQCPQRILMEILRWACSIGAIAINYVEAKSLLVENNTVTGIETLDRETGSTLQFRAPVVISSAGPWQAFPDKVNGQRSAAPFHPTLAFNLLLDREPLSEAALALTPHSPGQNEGTDAATYFLLPRAGKLIAGTSYVAVENDRSGERASSNDESTTTLRPTDQQIESFLSQLNQAAPSLRAKLSDVLHVESGVLPAVSAGSSQPTNRAVIIHHADHGGPTGLFTTAGIKYTTARAFAEKTLRHAFPKLAGYAEVKTNQPAARNMNFATRMVDGMKSNAQSSSDRSSPVTVESSPVIVEELRRLVEEESVLHLDDLLLRRTNWSDDPTRLVKIAQAVSQSLDWKPPQNKTPPQTIRC